MSKPINQRVLIKSDTSANWHTASTKGFKPLAGEFISYSDREHHNIKLGNGIHTPDELSWVAAQPDWNQNDETRVDFIKNRTHYECEGYIIKDVVVNGDQFYGTGTSSTYWLGLSMVLQSPLKPLTQYKVIMKGAEYNCRSDENGRLIGKLFNLELQPGDNCECYILIEERKLYIIYDAKIGKDEQNLISDIEPFSLSIYGPIIHQIGGQYVPIALQYGDGEFSIVQKDDPSIYEGKQVVNYTNATHAVVFGNNNKIIETIFDVGEKAKNAINGKNSFIAGGVLNELYSSNGFIAAGRENKVGSENINSYYSSIVGGMLNTIEYNYAFIGGGRNNNIQNSFSGIIGGQYNVISGQYSGIIGGWDNDVTNKYSGIIGGYENIITGAYGGILGGQSNNVAGSHNASVGGLSNKVYSTYNFAGGGWQNIVGTEGETHNGSGAIGGRQNKIYGQYCFTGGGYQNIINANGSFIGGGRNNAINKSYSGSVGGQNIVIDSMYSFASGYNIKLTTKDNDSKYAGGAGFGRYNLTTDVPLVIGNGTSDTARKDAFKVNWDGTVTAGADPKNEMDLTTKQYVDDAVDGKLTAVTDTGVMRAYIVGADGVQGVKEISESAVAYALPVYSKQGRLKTTAPLEGWDCVNKSHLDIALSGKLDAVTDKASNWRVYGMDTTGTQRLINLSWGAKADSLPYYNTNSQISTKTPTEDEHCANKAYVDTLIAELEKRIAALEAGGGYTLTFDSDWEKIDVGSAGYQVYINDEDISTAYYDEGINTFSNLKTFRINGGSFVLRARGSNPNIDYSEDELFTVETISGDDWYSRAELIEEQSYFEGVYEFTLHQDCTITYLREYDGENWE